MITRRHCVVLAAFASALLGPVAASAQAHFPNKPIRVVLPFASGSGTDNSARNFAQKVTEDTGWNFIIDNKPGANGFIGLSEVLRQPADGHTMVFTGGTTHGVNSAMFKKLPYDPIKDVVPVVFSGFSPMVLMARPSLKVDNAAQLVDMIRKNPGKLSVGTGSSFQILAVNLLRQKGELKFLDVPYKGSGQVMADLLGGHVDFAMVDVSAAMPQVRGGALKALAVTTAKRVPALPDVPTMAQAGLPDIQLSAWAALFVKTGTPQKDIDTLRAAFDKHFNSPDYKAFITNNGGYREDMTQAQMSDFIRAEIERAKTTFQRAGIEPQ